MNEIVALLESLRPILERWYLVLFAIVLVTLLGIPARVLVSSVAALLRVPATFTRTEIDPPLRRRRRAAWQFRPLGRLARDRRVPLLRWDSALPLRRRGALDREPREGDRRIGHVPPGVVPRDHGRVRDRVVRRRADARARVLR